MLLSKFASQRLHARLSARAHALVCASASIGVIVPPSLVLILLGDAMLRAHTEAITLAPVKLAGQRIIGTQDVFFAALIPAVLVFYFLRRSPICMHARAKPEQQKSRRFKRAAMRASSWSLELQRC